MSVVNVTEIIYLIQKKNTLITLSLAWSDLSAMFKIKKKKLIFSLFLNLWSCLSLATVSELNYKSPNPSFLSALCVSFLVLKSYWLGTLAELLLNLPIICIPDALFALAALLISLHFQQVASQKHADRCRRKSNTCHKIWPMISCLLGITSADNACCSQGSHSAQNQCYQTFHYIFYTGCTSLLSPGLKIVTIWDKVNALIPSLYHRKVLIYSCIPILLNIKILHQDQWTKFILTKHELHKNRWTKESK